MPPSRNFENQLLSHLLLVPLLQWAVWHLPLLHNFVTLIMYMWLFTISSSSSMIFSVIWWYLMKSSLINKLFYLNCLPSFCCTVFLRYSQSSFSSSLFAKLKWSLRDTNFSNILSSSISYVVRLYYTSILSSRLSSLKLKPPIWILW